MKETASPTRRAPVARLARDAICGRIVRLSYLLAQTEEEIAIVGSYPRPDRVDRGDHEILQKS